MIKFAIHNYVAITIRRSCNEMVRNCGITCNFQFYQNLSKPSKCIFSEAHPLAPLRKLRALLWNNKRIWWKTLKDFQKYNYLTKQISTLPVIHHINQIWLSWIDLYTMSTAAILVKFCTNVLRSLWSCHQKAFSYLTVIHRSGIMQGLSNIAFHMLTCKC